MIQVYFVENGHIQNMTREKFFENFGDHEANEILMGYAPHIVATELTEAALWN